jgi:outer membrane protein OmpA-like peptidoglycan-associated protein
MRKKLFLTIVLFVCCVVSQGQSQPAAATVDPTVLMQVMQQQLQTSQPAAGAPVPDNTAPAAPQPVASPPAKSRGKNVPPAAPAPITPKVSTDSSLQRQQLRRSTTRPTPASGGGDEIKLAKSTEFFVYAGTGLHGIMYNVDGNSSQMGSGANFGVGVNYFIADNIAISLGVGLGFFNAMGALPNISSEYKTDLRGDGSYTDSYGGTFYYRRELSGYTEKQSVTQLLFPLMVHYQTPYKFFIRFGAHLGLPINSVYTGKNASILQGAVFPVIQSDKIIYEGAGLYAGLPLVTSSRPYRMTTTTDELKTGFNILASLELGLRLSIADQHVLYVSPYVDYGLNNILEDAKTDFIVQVSDDYKGFTTRSMLNSYNPATDPLPSGGAFSIDNVTDVNALNKKAFVDDAKLLSIGIRVRYAFSTAVSDAKSLNLDGSAATPVNPWATAMNSMINMWGKIASSQVAQPQKKAEEKVDPKKKVVRKKDRDKFLRTLREPLIGFQPRQTNLTAAQKTKLKQKASALKQMPDVRIILYGYTCDLGEESLAIGLKRAQSVRDFLATQGIKKGRIQVNSRGESSPLVPNINAENRNLNSRVEFLEK